MTRQLESEEHKEKICNFEQFYEQKLFLNYQSLSTYLSVSVCVNHKKGFQIANRQFLKYFGITGRHCSLSPFRG